MTNHFITRSSRKKLSLYFQLMIPGCVCFFVSMTIVELIYPAYNEQNKRGKLFVALFAPLIGVVVKLISRICVQQLYSITQPGYSFVLLVPLYFGSAVVFRDGAVVKALASHRCGPGSIPVSCGLSLLLVLVLTPRVFLRVLRFSSLYKNQHFQIPIRPGRQVFTHEPLAWEHSSFQRVILTPKLELKF